MTENEIDIALEKLQSKSVNNGGVFRFIKSPISNKTDLEKTINNLVQEAKFISIYNKQIRAVLNNFKL